MGYSQANKMLARPGDRQSAPQLLEDDFGFFQPVDMESGPHMMKALDLEASAHLRNLLSYTFPASFWGSLGPKSQPLHPCAAVGVHSACG